MKNAFQCPLRFLFSTNISYFLAGNPISRSSKKLQESPHRFYNGIIWRDR
jgi:hypothetical protein